MADHVLIQMRKTKRIKEQWVNFVRIELGKIRARIEVSVYYSVEFVVGMEVFYQVAGQIILLLYTTTETRTKVGLETVLEEFLGLKKEIFGYQVACLIPVQLIYGKMFWGPATTASFQTQI